MNSVERFLARLWRWHTGWCPGWKAYQAHLAEQAKLQPTLTKSEAPKGNP